MSTLTADRPATAAPPSPESNVTVSELMQLFYRARAHRRPLLARWQRNYQVLHNRAWGVERPSHVPTPDPPEIKPIISSLVAWMIDNEPTFDVLPSANPFSEFYAFYDQLSQDLAVCLRSAWQANFCEAEVEKLLWDGFTYGVGIIKTVWDAGLVSGLGDYNVRRVDPWSFYPDPNATDMSDSTFFVEVRNMARQEVERRWPGTVARLSADYRTTAERAPDRLTSHAEGTRPLANPGAITSPGPSTWGLPGQSSERVSGIDDDGVTVFEFWLKAPTSTPAPPEPQADDPSDPFTPAEERLHDLPPSFDAWRCVIVVGNQIVVDEPAANLWSHARHPYSRYVPEDTGEFYSDSLVETLTPLQVSINRALASIEQNINLSGNPVLVESPRSDIPRTKITNAPGQRLKVNGNVGDAVRWLEPPRIDPRMIDLVTLYIGEMERVSGMSAIVRGATPTGRNAQGVLDSVQDAAFVRLRMNLRNLERSLTDSGNLAASNVAEFYDRPRVVSLVGPGGEASALAVAGAHFYVPTSDGRLPLNFAVRVGVGSRQATSRQARFNEAMTMFGVQLIDAEAALEMIDFPGWRQVVERVKSAAAAQAAAQDAPANLSSLPAGPTVREATRPTSPVQGMGGPLPPPPSAAMSPSAF